MVIDLVSGAGLGLLAIVLLALLHNFGLTCISAWVPRNEMRSHWVTLAVFSLLGTLHLIEIALLAGYTLALATFVWPQAIVETGQQSFLDYLYFAGSNFSTLGLARAPMQGPIRIVLMMQALAGFMLLTWSAGYLYAACGRYWRKQ